MTAVFGVRILCGRGVRFEVEVVEVVVNGLSREKILFTGTEATTGWVREVKEVRDGDEGRVIAVEEVIVLDEGTKGME